MHTFTSPFTFANGIKLKNRVVLAPMTNGQSHADGTLSDAELRWLEMRARGGFGLLVSAASHVQLDAQAWAGQLGCFADGHVAGLKRLAALGRAHDCATVLQLFHGGVRSPRALTGAQPTAPSAVTLDFPGFETPRALEEREIEAIIANFVAAGTRAHQAGLTGVEIHGANGYLITQFLSRVTNQRTDRWGGARENRARLVREITKGLRAKVPREFLIGVRLLAEDAPNQTGFDVDETIKVAGELAALGVDYVHVSAGDVGLKSWAHPNETETNLRRVRAALPDRVAVMGCGGVATAERANFALAEGADLVAIGKAAIRCPDWPRLAEHAAFAPPPFPMSESEASAVGAAPAFVEILKHFGLVSTKAKAG